MPSSRPIIVLDSGLGGLTVARAIRRALPQEDVLYFGDTARLPYGSKTADTVSTFVKQIVAYLLPFNPKHVVLACNTATALAMPALRTTFPDLSISGVIEPGAKAAVVAAGAKPCPTIAVIATEATIRSRAYERAIHRRRHHARLLLKATPLLVPIIEEGRRPDDPLVRLALKQYLQPLCANRKPDVLVLGCTHYPIFKDLISRMLGPTVRVIDSAEQCADDVSRRLRANGLLKPAPQSDAAAAEGGPGELSTARWSGGDMRCFVTDDPQRFGRLASRFLGFDIPEPTWVCPDDLYATALPSPATAAVGEPVRLSVPA
jgi:glutamate racemase